MGNKQALNIDATQIYSICINCRGLLGDTLIRVPLIEAIATTCPQAKITAITDPGRQILLKNHPNVNNIITFNRQKKPLFNYLKGFIAFTKQIRNAHYDLMIDLYGGGSSISITQFSKAKYRIGFYRNRREKTAYTHGVAYPHHLWDSRMYHWGQQFGLLLKPFGLGTNDLRAGTTFIPTINAQQQASNIMTNIKQPWILINMGAGDIRKIWAVEKYLALAKWLQQTYDYHIGVFVNPGQENLAKEFVQLASAAAFTAFTALDLSDLDIIGALIQKAKFVISGDTDLMHLAIGVKAPTLAIFTHTRPEAVQPEDVCFIACFIANENKKNAFGMPMGCEDLSLECTGENSAVAKKITLIDTDGYSVQILLSEKRFLG